MTDTTAIKKLLQSPETVGTVIHAIIRNLYGEQAYDWDVLTTTMDVKDQFRVDMDSAVADRWGAMQTVMTTNAFFTRLDAFMAICNTLSTGNPYFDVFDPASVEEVAWGISEVSLNRDMLPFSYPIKQYIKQLLDADGYAGDAPDIFDYVLEPGEQEKTLRAMLHQLYTSPNKETVELYINDQLKDMVSQFNQIPALAKLDDILLHSNNATVASEIKHEGDRR